MPSNNSKKLRKSTTKESINDLSGSSSVQSQIVIKKDSTKRIKTKVASSNEQSSIPLGQQPSTSNSVHYREKLEQLLEDSKSKTFNKKEFKFGVKTKQYSAIYHFFDCKTEFDNKPNKDDKFNFKCIICKTVISSKLGKTSNLIKHNILSQVCDLLDGVPQGSVLGPLLFLIYINDMGLCNELYIELFADDTTITMSDQSIEKLISSFKNNIESVLEWVKYNQLTINWSKTKVMFITRKKIELPNEIYIRNDAIK